MYIASDGPEAERLGESSEFAVREIIRRVEGALTESKLTDSERACIDTNTRNIMAIFFTPPEVEKSYLEETLTFLRQLYVNESPSATIHSYIIQC